MKVFKVYVSEEDRKKWGGNWYDEYFGHVVIAENEEEAIRLAYEVGLLVPREQATVEEIIPTKKGIVLSDFNAG
ncbi:hypothetical protein [Enterococcus mundtii]|uniref:hypothetical protein n=1 Tax=Enterococcus mundtii TaxID=53346 RepID=UPI0004503CBF|nr:hypothetical protein [Enterococcus mundtii]EYT96369.1 hypothetical protein AK89_03880 [Enterococcus mundtii CRL35]